MNWDAIGALGELVGAIAVVFTLAFLAIQIRHGSRAIDQQNSLAESDAVSRSVELVGQFRRLLASDKELAAVWRKGQSAEELDEADMVRFRHLAMSFFEVISAIYFQNMKSGRNKAAEQVVILHANNLITNPGLRTLWEKDPFLLDPAQTGFGEEIEAKLKELEESGT